MLLIELIHAGGVVCLYDVVGYRLPVYLVIIHFFFLSNSAKPVWSLVFRSFVHRHFGKLLLVVVVVMVVVVVVVVGRVAGYQDNWTIFPVCRLRKPAV